MENVIQTSIYTNIYLEILESWTPLYEQYILANFALIKRI